MAMQRFQIGQIVFLLPVNEQKIIPAKIVEEVIRRTVNSEPSVRYFAITKPNSKEFLIDKNFTAFNDIESARRYMNEKVEIALNKICDHAVAQAQIFKNDSLPSTSVEVEEDDMEDTESLNENVALVRLPDGSVAKLDTSSLAKLAK